MKPTLRCALLLAVAATMAMPVAHAAEPALEGLYGAEGFNPDGSEYRGVVKIVRRGESYVVAWIFPSHVGEEIVFVAKSAGVGLARGATLAVSYYGQDATGVVLYQIEKGGERLVGRWVSANGEGVVHSETLTKLPASAVAPEPGITVSPGPRLRKPLAVTRGAAVARR